ncbi:MAG: hypothetical protein DRP97_00485 [Candidatus Latescibacterota bacterium]|nr:MAG: hypothetical protein DRP97_00485 [Candidatus Latescibacterota bacterium]
MSNLIEPVVIEQLKPFEIAEQVVKLQSVKKEVDSRLKEMKASLLETTKSLDVLTLKTGSYTISRATRSTVKVLDKKALSKELESMNVEVVYGMDMDYMKPVVKKLVDDLDNAEVNETEYVSIRINKKKEDK